MWKYIRPYIRKVYRLIMGMFYFMYDYSRYLRYGGWKGDLFDRDIRNYSSVMVYHGIEKSLSYKKRNPGSGWKNAYKILDLLRIAKRSNNIGYHDRASKQVLEKFINLPENISDERSKKILEELGEYYDLLSNDTHGALHYNIDDYEKGVLESPEEFFFSRYSLREFKNIVVKDEDIRRAIGLSMKTPSVCNRQAWGIYHTSDRELKDIILTYQHGNKPFGENIPNLIIVTTDLKAFFSASEHNQHLIDGGLLAMSLIYAFHSIGVATCPLNWSAKPKDDMGLRKYINIKGSHTIIMILAIGYPEQNNIVCASARRPLEEVFFELEKR